METEVVGNSVEVSLSSSATISIASAFVLAAGLTLLAGWQVAFVALGLSLLVAVGLDVAQRLDY